MTIGEGFKIPHRPHNGLRAGEAAAHETHHYDGDRPDGIDESAYWAGKSMKRLLVVLVLISVAGFGLRYLIHWPH